MKQKMRNLLKNVKNSLNSNSQLVASTIKNLDQAIKKATTFKQRILKKAQKTLSAAQKRHLDTLETEINSLTAFKKPLEEIRANFLNKLQALRSFAFKLKP